MQPRSNKRLNAQAGFTLLEILLAIAVLSIMMMLIFTLTSESSNTIDRVIVEDRDYMQVETALSIIDRDFQNYYNPLFTEAQEAQEQPESGLDIKTVRPLFPSSTTKGKLVPLFNVVDKTELIFMTSGHQRRIENSKQSHYAWVRYSLESIPNDQKKENNKAQYRLLRQYTADNPYQETIDWSKVKAHYLLANIFQLKFSYWNEEKKDFVETLDELSPKQQAVRLMQVEFTWIDRNNFESKVTRTFRALQVPFDSRDEIKKKVKKNDDLSLSPPEDNGEGLPPAGDDGDD